MGTELPVFHPLMAFACHGEQSFEQVSPVGRIASRAETGPRALARIRGKRELRYEQQAAAGVCQGSVHATGRVGKNTVAEQAVEHPPHLAFTILGFDGDKRQQAGSNGADDRAIHGDACRGDALDEADHAWADDIDTVEPGCCAWRQVQVMLDGFTCPPSPTMRLDVALLYLLIRLMALMPLRALHATGAGMGWLLWRARSRATHHVRVNMALVRPQLDAPAREILVRDAMLQSGRSMVEMAWIWGRHARRALEEVHEVRGRELFDAALASERGLIIAAPHLGCWELLNYWLCAQAPMAILYRPPRFGALEPLLRKVRGDLAPEQVRAQGPGVRVLFKRLKEGGHVGILPDQKPRAGDGRIVPFFGHDALTMVLLPRLAARTDATVLFAFAERLPQGRGYRIHFLPAPPGIADTDLDTACSALNRGVEQCVERAFTQYQWAYRRFSGHGLANPYRKSPADNHSG